MAATDKNYRNQYALDIFFALSSLAMLLSLIWMFAQDYSREYKVEQRTFRDVETAMAQRLAFDQIPSAAEFDKAKASVEQAHKEREQLAETIDELRQKMAKDRPDKEISEVDYNKVKADLDSRMSFLYIVLERDPKSELVEVYRKDIQALTEKVKAALEKKDDLSERMKQNQAALDLAEKPLTDALSELKKINDKFDTQVKLAIAKRWGPGDWFRDLPILDGFAPPLKIHQFTINDYQIDYNFKYVTRFDRCMTCHQGIDRPAFTRANVQGLTQATMEQRVRRDEAIELLKQRHEALKGLPEAKNLPSPNQLKLTKISPEYLTAARVTEFAAHPRLDLFVGPNSKHPAEKFGCTSCHAGQGSSTSFVYASHTPNDTAAKQRWQVEHDWVHIHDWEFPMHPHRFVQSGCLKCHHQVTDLVSSDNRNEAPRLLQGYNLIKENGCFGCHEIAGRKAGKQIGPDIRLEPKPPLADLTPGERAKLEADVDNPPGNMRKVGPSLNRLMEKTNREFVAKWIKAPRDFRPDTKMPHYYGLTNNTAGVLPEAQKKFPDAEIHCIAHFLFENSQNYLTQGDLKARLKSLKEKKDPTPAEAEELKSVEEQLKLPPPAPLPETTPKDYKPNPENGRMLFSERGCLACHSHHATEKAQGKVDQPNYVPAIHSEANFGPNLSQLKAKLGAKAGDAALAAKWLTKWILDPQFHSPRSRMPVTHLTVQEAADVAAWLLDQEATDLGAGWASLSVEVPDEKTLEDLAKVYFTRLMSARDMKKVFDKHELSESLVKELPDDERALVSNFTQDNLKFYLGKKAVGRLGCFGCHDINGFDKMKSIGVGLNDWGKKDGNRLAFEDVAGYVKKRYHLVPSLVDSKGKPLGPVVVKGEKGEEQKKNPYDLFFFDALEHQRREGFLNQKLLEPRSFDYERILAWDDRARMPEFRFARSKKRDGESDEDFTARTLFEEAEAREAVMTFVLGLVAEPIPSGNINQPKGDRLAEVKGRQILEKYNCAGCHLLRSGVIDINLKGKDVQKKLEQFYNIAKSGAVASGDHFFPDHFYWTGKNPTSPDKLTALGVNGQLIVEETGDPVFQFRLAQALRFQAADKSMKDITAQNYLQLDPKDVIYPPLPPLTARAAIPKDEAEAYYNTYKEKLKRELATHGPWGGMFANLLVPYLVKKDRSSVPPFFKPDNPEDEPANPRGDSAPARAAVPPILLAQGERTQPDWLYNFLLNPQPVRRMTVLRMPRFNMSKEEARALVDYFAGVEHIQNPKTGLTFPFETIVQQGELNDAYWQQKTKEYVSRLKAVDGGKEFKKRIEELTPVWQQVLKDNEAKLTSAKSKVDILAPRVKDLKKEEEKLDKEVKDAKDEAKKKKLESSLKELQEKLKVEEDSLKPWQDEVELLTQSVKASAITEQQKNWEENEAYLTDGYRLLANKQICMQCHQVGKFPVNNQTQGPPLYLAHQRLRPGWTERWIATPQRFLTYGSAMPNNFPETAKREEWKFQEFFAGSPNEQVQAVRDVLMAYPRASALPVNHYWYLPLPGEKK